MFNQTNEKSEPPSDRLDSVGQVFLTLPNDEEQMKEHMASFGYKRDVIDAAISELRQKGVIVNGKISKDKIPVISSELPTSIREKGWQILGLLENVADSHNRGCSTEIDNYKAKLRQFAINSSTGEFQSFSRWFVDTATQKYAKKLTEKIKNASRDFFHGGKTARQKEAEKRQKEQEELRRKAQELVDQTHPLANKDKYLIADTSDPFLRPPGAYPYTYGPSTLEAATPESNDTPKEDREFKQSFNGVVHDDMGSSFGGGCTPPADDTTKKLPHTDNVEGIDDVKNMQLTNSLNTLPKQTKSIFNSLKSSISAKDILIDAGMWMIPGTNVIQSFKYAHYSYKVGKFALKAYDTGNKLYKAKKFIDKLTDKRTELTKCESNNQLPAKEFKFDAKKFEIKPKDTANIKDAKLPAENVDTGSFQIGKVGSYYDLGKVLPKGSGYVRHHTPFKHFMKQFEVSTGKGTSIVIPKKVHIKLHQILKKQDLNQDPRKALLESTKVLKQALKETNHYTPEIRRSTIETIRQNKEKFPGIFNKK